MVTSIGEDRGARRPLPRASEVLAVSYFELDGVHMGLHLILIYALHIYHVHVLSTLPKEKVGNYFDLKELSSPVLFFPQILL